MMTESVTDSLTDAVLFRSGRISSVNIVGGWVVVTLFLNV